MSSDKELEAIIVGGSLAGLVAALALARTGASITVVERASRHRTGAALTTSPSELTRVLGPELGAKVAGKLAEPGRRLSGSQSIVWHDLRAALVDAVHESENVTLREGIEVTRIDEGETSVSVELESGVILEADLVIGADGHRSIVRHVVAPDRPNAEFAGYLLWVGIAEERDLNLSGGWPHGFDIISAGPEILLGYPLPSPKGSLEKGQRRLGFAWYDAGHNQLLRQAGAVRDGVVRHSMKPEDIPEEIYQKLARKSQRRWPDPWRAAIEDCVRRRDITATPIAEYVPERLVSSRCALVGNAAHVPTPMTGRGFAVSVDDAVALAEVLASTTPNEIPAALLEYEKDRLGSARNLVQSGQSFSRSFAG
ncbi:FAD-dependent monooxygenase [Corynebacterium lubricantis]|uniref:FAD-dependent monooxygenase n=1 Tax=Corynebacterium lubricantis TaxID=541095 RepID=UPI000381767F|nr:FAD-dependent monooxygenase [Corynebacterium lubricantis]